MSARAGMLLRWLRCACIALTTSACSLMDLGDFGLTNCDDPALCDPLNQRDGLGANACVIWQCRKDKRGCEQRPRDLDNDGRPSALACPDLPGPLDCEDNDDQRAPGKSESCDAKDNDCDGLIDEGAAPELAQHPVGMVQAPDFLSYTQDESDALYLMLGTQHRGLISASAQGWLLSGGEAPPPHPVSYAFPADPQPNDELACAGPDKLTDCQFSELALAAVDGELVTAGVITSQCARGQMRVGLSDPNDFTVQLGSAAQDSNVEWGVDVDIVDDCTTVEGARGARSPRIAALAPDSSDARAEALALWLAARSDQECSGETPVVALALWPHGDKSGHWLQGGHGGHAETLGASAGCGAPSLTALHAGKNSGYAVAYPGADSLELVWLPRPGALDASLSALARHASVPAAEPSHLALAMLPDGETQGGRGLLVAFRTTDAHGNALGFAPIGWSADGLVPGEAQSLPRNAEISAGPVAAYAREGFASAAQDASESRGGWLIVWVERDASGSHLLGLRVADVGGGTILGEPIALDGGGDPQFPFVCAAGAGGFELGFVAREGSTSELTLGNLSCPASG